VNALEYQRAVRATLGLGENDTAALPADDVLRALNDGLKAISMEWEWYWLFRTASGTTVADTPTVAAPAGYLRTVSFKLGDRVLTERTFADLADNQDRTGSAAHFALAGPNFYLWPTPKEAEAFTHVYYGTEPALATDTDVPLLPVAYSPWLVAEAALKLALRTNSVDKYAILQAEASAWRSRAVGDVKRKRNAAPRKIGRTRTGFLGSY
jgi:hypothetical protein